MGDSQQKVKKDKKPLYFLIGVFVTIVFLMTFIAKPSTHNKAIRELGQSSNIKDVKELWFKYKTDLSQDEEFLQEIRKKIDAVKLSEDEVNTCLDWLPPAPKSINLIIIPDLSRRIIDVNNNEQIKNDKFVLGEIWKAFKDFSKLRQNTKDRLMVDVTDIDQANGQFRSIADSLQFDLSSHKEQSNRLFFKPDIDKRFDEYINKMYELAKQQPLGADYRFYFRRYLKNRLKKRTLYDDYFNKVIIITDGYLETEDSHADTKISGFENQLHQAVLDKNILSIIAKNGLNIPKESWKAV